MDMITYPIRGAGDGCIIAADAYTFGQIDGLNRAANKRVDKHGDLGKASRVCGYTSAVCAYSAAYLKGTEILVPYDGGSPSPNDCPDDDSDDDPDPGPPGRPLPEEEPGKHLPFPKPPIEIPKRPAA